MGAIAQPMKIVAYLYHNPLLDAPTDPHTWGWDVDRVYRDLATSGTTTRGKANPDPGSKVARPELHQLLQDCETEAIDYVILRRLEDLGEGVQAVSDRLSQLEHLGVRIITLDCTYDSQTPVVPGSDLRAALVQLLQQIQRNQRSQRIRQGHARSRVKALPPPGKAPYGYRRGKDRYALDRAAAAVVKDFFEQFLLYGSLRGAVRHLAQKHGKTISVSTGQRWLTNPVYRGDLEYQTGEVVPDTHVAILSREEAAQVDRLLRRNRRLPPRTASAPRSLAGLVVCGACQSSMTVTRVSRRGKDGEYLYLRPAACDRQPRCRSLLYDQVLQAIIERICDDLPKAVAGLPLPDLDRIKQGMDATIAQKQQILTQLPDLVTCGVLDGETADLRAYKLRTEIATLQSQRAQLPPVNLQSTAQAVSIPQFWLDLSEAERRFYFREFIRQVQLVRQDREWEVRLVFIFGDGR